MILEKLASSALGYLVTAILKSKGGQQAADETSVALWDWVSPIFLKDDEAIEDLKKEPNDKDNQQEVALKIKKHLKKNPESENGLKALLEKLEASDEKPASLQIIQTHSGTGDNVGGNKITNG